MQLSLQTPHPSPRLEYLLAFLNEHPYTPEGVRWNLNGTGDHSIRYGEGKQAAYGHIPAQGMFLGEGWAPTARLQANAYTFGDSTLYSVETEKRADAPFWQDGRFGFDLLETLFFHISRYEEWTATSGQLDAHGRMLSDSQFLVRQGLERQAVADRMVWALYEALGIPPTKPQAVQHFTSDLDLLRKLPSLWKYSKALGNMVLRQHSLSGTWKLKKQYFQTAFLGRPDPFDTFDRLLLGGGGDRILYILTGNDLQGIEGHFSLEDPRLKQVVRLADERGWAVGLHPGYQSSELPGKMAREKERLEAALGRPMVHSRQHYLRWNWPRTPAFIEQAGLQTDSSLGFSDRLGFRCGTAFPYKLYHFGEERPFHFRELPLVIMDIAWLRAADITFDRPSWTKEKWARAQADLEDFLHLNRALPLRWDVHNSSFDEVYVKPEEIWASVTS